MVQISRGVRCVSGQFRNREKGLWLIATLMGRKELGDDIVVFLGLSELRTPAKKLSRSLAIQNWNSRKTGMIRFPELEALKKAAVENRERNERVELAIQNVIAG